MPRPRTQTYRFATRTRLRPSGTEGWAEKYSVHWEGVGKANRGNHRYVVANEFIAGRLGTLLGLPVPPFALMRRSHSTQLMFVSTNYSKEVVPADVVPAALWERQPRLCTGIVVFDAWVANYDRHSGNIKVDDPQDPREVHVFDHDRAVFDGADGRGSREMAEWKDHAKLGHHCLRGEVDDRTHFDEWIGRVERVPGYMIEDACRDARGTGITAREESQAVEFLTHRQSQLGGMLFADRTTFPKLSDWPLTEAPP